MACDMFQVMRLKLKLENSLFPYSHAKILSKQESWGHILIVVSVLQSCILYCPNVLWCNPVRNSPTTSTVQGPQDDVRYILHTSLRTDLHTVLFLKKSTSRESKIKAEHNYKTDVILSTQSWFLESLMGTTDLFQAVYIYLLLFVS